jgi:peptidoglycan/LPS O-acetylase OafA/YrhL
MNFKSPFNYARGVVPERSSTLMARIIGRRAVSTPRDPASARFYIPTLDGWRAVAILLVMAAHFGTAFFTQDAYWSSSPTRFGVIGVPIFFAMSGFLITTLLIQESVSRGSISLRAFYVRRCFRILPPLFALLAGISLLGLMASRIELLSSLLFFRNYLPPAEGRIYTGHLWSLSVEEHFYLLWPACLCLLLRRRHVLFNTACIALSFGIWRSVEFHLHLLHRVAPVLDTPMRTDLGLDGLMWGCCAGIIFQDRGLREAASRLLTLPVTLLTLVLLIASLLRPLPLSSVWGPITIPLIILGTVTHKNWLASRVLESAPVRWLGRTSYSLYLWQQLFLMPSWEPHPLKLAQKLPLDVFLPFLCAIVSHYWIERPAIRFGRRLASRISGGAQGREERSPALGELA